MPYCPTCKQEFSEGNTTCPEHGGKLVDELPFQVVPGDDGAWVEIASCGTQDEARLLQGFLVAEGIAAQIENVKFSMEPVNFGAMGDVRVYVSADDERAAAELLKSRDDQYQLLARDGETVVTDDGPAEIDDNAVAETELE